MKTFRFVVAEHEVGSLGFRPRWYPTGDPLGGMAVAHDILEHFPGDEGSTEEELQALGASLFVRGDGGWSNRIRPYDRVRDPAADIPMLWDRFLQANASMRQAPRVRDEDAMEDGRAIIQEALREIRHQFEGSADSIPEQQTRENMARWIAVGYVRARRRYRRVIGGAGTLASLSMEIERESEEALKNAAEGMELIVRIDVTRGDVRVSCDYPGEERS